MTTRATQAVFELLETDLVSSGTIGQCLRSLNPNELENDATLKDFLKEILSSGNVEIGNAKMASPNYVEFEGWIGDVDEKIDRARKAIEMAEGANKEFAFWLCLTKNVDRYES